MLDLYGPEVTQPGTFAAWARSEKLDPDEILTTGLQVLSALMQAPRLAVLVTPPTTPPRSWAWTALASPNDETASTRRKRRTIGDIRTSFN